MLKKTITLLILCCAIGAVIFISGCVKQETEFSLKSWEVIDDNGVHLVVSFNASNDVCLYITDPNGVETDRDYIEQGITGAKLRLAGYAETPQAGTYILIVKDEKLEYGDVISTIIFTKEISFTGADVSIVESTPNWEYDELLDKYALDSLTISVKNKGDLPAYIDKADVGIDRKIRRLLFYPEVVLQNQEKTIAMKAMDRGGISSGKHEMTVILKDSSKIISTTSTTGSTSVSSTILITGSVMWGSVPVPGAIVELKEAGNYYTMPV
ncbi:MAG: hypothetical protein KAT65_19775, partial [Methanophagales archaeon]|nr:hypothetical protein [Methanophagales archaeon]